MTQRDLIFVFGTIVLIVAAIVLGVIYYSTRVGRRSTALPSPTPFSISVPSSPTTQFPISEGSPSPSPTATPGSTGTRATPTPAPVTESGQYKVYHGVGFSLSYPKNWGLLTCNNSQNIELSPTNSSDTLNYNCDYAIRPVTVLVKQELTCSGQTLTLGAHSVRKTRTTYSDGDVHYRWCVINPSGVDLEISHRVSQRGSRASSSQDYSEAVEDMISRISFN